MAIQNCVICGDRRADMIISLTANGESVWLCLPHAPDYVKTIWDSAGLPPYVMDFDDQALGESDMVGVEAPGVASVEVYEGPGALERAEMADGPVTPVVRSSGGRKRAVRGRQEGGGVAEAESEAADV